MNRVIKYFLAFLSLFFSLEATSKYPVDVSFLIADLKYSKDSGVKICEIQHGCVSTFYGDAYLYEPPGMIVPNFYRVMSQFPMKKWTTLSQVASASIRSVVTEAFDWEIRPSCGLIFKDVGFQDAAKEAPKNPNDLSFYQGILLARPSRIPNYATFREGYPGIVVMDAATFPYWIDKYKMSELFNQNRCLVSFKPEWRLYQKKNSEELARQVIEDIPSDTYVIKPRSSFLGRGVIIVSREELETTLRYIFDKNDELQTDSDQSYQYWYQDPHQSFIVEKFYPSDLIVVPELDNRVYHPTMRMAFILTYSNEMISIDFLGDYWLLPDHSMDEEGSLNNRCKAYCKAPFFAKVSPEVREEVQKQLREMLPLLYQEMLRDR